MTELTEVIIDLPEIVSVPFIETYHCSSRAHCRTCQTNSQWRAAVGAPDICPFGNPEPIPVLITGDGVPPIQDESALRTPEEVEANVAICQTCEYLVGDICVKFSKMCGCTGRHRTRIKSITCPEGKWQ